MPVPLAPHTPTDAHTQADIHAIVTGEGKPAQQPKREPNIAWYLLMAAAGLIILVVGNNVYNNFSDRGTGTILFLGGAALFGIAFVLMMRRLITPTTTSPLPARETPPLSSVYQSSVTTTMLPTFIGAGGVLLDFWSTILLNGKVHTTELLDAMRTTMKAGGHSVKQADIAFSTAIFAGRARPFVKITERHILGLVYIGTVGPGLQDIYISLRVVFLGMVSFLKFLIITLLFTPPAFFLSAPVGLFLYGFTSHPYDYPYSNVYEYSSWYILGFVAVLLGQYVVLIGFSIWRYGDAQYFFRQDINEIDRDDASAMGYELYLAIMAAADALHLEHITPERDNIPLFGAATNTTHSKKRRI